TGIPATLTCETRTSGPPRGSIDPFSTGKTDVGFLCSPAYAWLVEREPPAVALLPAAPVFADARAGGRPVYFSDVIVRREAAARTFDDLRGAIWAYNDTCSLSGYLNLRRHLDKMEGLRLIASGSHLASLKLVASGGADAAAIDSN